MESVERENVNCWHEPARHGMQAAQSEAGTAPSLQALQVMSSCFVVILNVQGKFGCALAAVVRRSQGNSQLYCCGLGWWLGSLCGGWGFFCCWLVWGFFHCLGFFYVGLGFCLFGFSLLLTEVV